ncbi:glutamate-gated chloride channel alpha-like [Palaemon carinicauda]|uniref:glutamate-gated chloride channel alpha-like n=1 Tax=Palaemon carinicauda TaxID=392227 RepID=UPI0035B63296
MVNFFYEFLITRQTWRCDIRLRDSQRERAGRKRSGFSPSSHTIYPTSSGEMVQRILYSASFNCNFRLFYYPFDVQTCNIFLKLTSATSAVITFKATFQLERRYSLLVLSIFIPTALLLGIGYTTLFVKLQLLQVRAIMTQTTLLVLYTLFNQVSSNLPDTAYIKMVDVWFFFCIFLIFSVIVLHIMVENLEPGVHKGQRKIINVAPSAAQRLKSNPMEMIVEPPSSLCSVL